MQENTLTEIKTVNTIDPSERCKICYMYNNPIDSTCDLISPCGCKGSIKYVHKTCLRLWRFKGKHLREIKTCEQCFCEYKVEEDVIPNKMFVQLLTFISTVLLFIFSHFAINLLVESLSFIVDEIILHRSIYDDYYSTINQLFHDKNNHDFLNSMLNRKFYISSKPSILKLSFIETSVVTIIFYQVLFNYGLISTINLFFTLWRIINFEYRIDYLFLFVICIYYFRKLYTSMYTQIDNVLYFVVNNRY